MALEIRNLRKEDYKKAINFAITGMHFNWYMESRFLLNLYGRYFWYLEMTRATQVIAAYADDELAGCCLRKSMERTESIVRSGSLSMRKPLTFCRTSSPEAVSMSTMRQIGKCFCSIVKAINRTEKSFS